MIALILMLGLGCGTVTSPHPVSPPPAVVLPPTMPKIKHDEPPMIPYVPQTPPMDIGQCR